MNDPLYKEIQKLDAELRLLVLGNVPVLLRPVVEAALVRWRYINYELLRRLIEQEQKNNG